MPELAKFPRVQACNKKGIGTDALFVSYVTPINAVLLDLPFSRSADGTRLPAT